MNPYLGKPGLSYRGAAYNALMEDETKESLVLLYLDALDHLTTLESECQLYRKRWVVKDAR